MSTDIFRTIETYLDVNRSLVVDNIGTPVREKIVLYRKTETIMRVHLKVDNENYFTPVAGANWDFIIDDSFDPEHADLVHSDNAQFNIPGDWDDLDVAGGKISFRVNTATTQLETAMGVDASKEMWGDLWMTAPGEDPSLVTEFAFTMHNIVSDIGNVTELEYVSSNIIKFDGDDVVIYFPDGSEARRFQPM